MRLLLVLTIICIMPIYICYYSQVNINTTASATISNFQKDLSACSCDISTACDTFCCCDSKCTADLITKWSNNNWCAVSAVEIQKLCQNIGSKGFSSFQDLGCVMYSNRGDIGIFYTAPNSNSFVDPNINKFQSTHANTPIKPYTIPTQTKYQQNSPLKLKINTISKPLIVYLPSIDQSCRQSYIPLTQGSYTSTCSYPILTQQQCLDINNQTIGSTFLFCQFGNCSSYISPTNVSSVSIATYNNASGACSGVVTQVTVSIVMGYQNGEYKIVSGSLQFVTAVNISKIAYLTTSVTIRKSGVSTSGNPGYLIGKSIQYSSGNIFQIADPTTKACLSTSSANQLPLKFGVNQTFYCFTTSPCSSFYIDQIAKATTYKFKKYASQATQYINTTSSTSQVSCPTEYTLYLAYTYSGWVMDQQNYLIGSQIVTQSTANSNLNIKMKQLNVKWIKIQPDSVASPPNNYFYTYFQYLWTPISAAFYKVVGS